MVQRVVRGLKFSRWEGGVLVNKGTNPQQNLGFIGGATAVEERVDEVRQNHGPATEINPLGALRESPASQRVQHAQLLAKHGQFGGI